MAETSDVIVIGAGIAGASAAAELAAGLSVRLLEMEDRPGYHSTGRSAATFVPSYGPPVIRALTRASADVIVTPPEDFCADPIVAPRGEFVLGLPGDDIHIDAYRQIGMHDIDLDEACTRIPLLKRDALQVVLCQEDAYDLDVDLLHRSYLRLFKQRGGKLVCNAEVTALSRDGGAWTAATPAGTYAAPVVVDAAGAWADQVAGLAGVPPVGLQPRRRSIAVVTPPDGVDVDTWPLAISAGETFYFKAQSGKLLISPADQTPVEPHDAWADDMALAEAIDRIQGCLDIEVNRIDHTWGGLRSFVADGDPVAGFDPDADGFFWLAGQGGYGIMTSPALARITAALVSGNAVPTDIANCGVTSEQLSPARL